MTPTDDPRLAGKRAAAQAALDHVRDGMTIGLGSGSTADIFTAMLGETAAANGWRIRGVATSQSTERCAEKAGIALISLNAAGALDLAVDGADEVDGDFNLIKGGGACLFREKLVAEASPGLIVVVDETKLVSRLGKFPLPVEIEPFGHETTMRRMADIFARHDAAECALTLRKREEELLITDGGHYIVDCPLGAIRDSGALADELKGVTGVIEHGLFIGLTQVVIVGEAGGARVLTA